MRNASEKFIKALGEYLKKAFSTRVEKANEENPDLGLADIVLWQDGYRGVASGLSEYPGCIILLNGRTLTDVYTTTYHVIVGIGLAGDDADHLEMQGRAWEDILEDSLRSDWTLGGAALDTALGVSIRSDSVSNVYVIQAEFDAQVDLNGYVYMEDGSGGDSQEDAEGTASGSDVLQEMRISDRGSEGDPMSEVSDSVAEDDSRESEEDASL